MQIKFKLDLGKVQQYTHDLWAVFFSLNEKGISDDFEKRGGLIQTCNYAIEDSQSAIDSYKKLPAGRFEEIRYLALYGLFQAFFVQQDAFSTLFKSFLNQKLDFKVDYPGLYGIREIRNITTGHPTDRKNEYFLISQITLKKNKYYLVGHNVDDKKNGMEIEVLPKLFFEQEKGIIELFKKFKRELKKLK